MVFGLASVAYVGVATCGVGTSVGACEDGRCLPEESEPRHPNAWNNPEYGSMVNDLLWQSRPIVGPWIPYTQRRTIFFRVKDDVRSTPGHDVFRKVSSIDVTITTVETPSDPAGPGSNFVPTAGNLALIYVNPDERSVFTVTNDTCAPYFVRVVAHLEPYVEPPPVAVADAGSEDAGTRDADASDADGTFLDASLDASEAGGDADEAGRPSADASGSN